VYYPNQYDSTELSNSSYVSRDNEVYYPNQGSGQSNSSSYKSVLPIGVRSIKAFFVNTSRFDEIEERIRKKTRFVARYPIEPSYECFTSTPYNTCSSGCPAWRALPNRFVVAPYHGFGWKPEWGGIYKPVPKDYGLEYFAPVIATKDQNIVEVRFPARAQRFTGKYKLVIVADVYAPGFNFNNIRTISIDMPDVFELVKTSQEGVDTGVVMTVNPIEDTISDIYYTDDVEHPDIYVDSGSYSNNHITLNRTDGYPVGVDVSEFTAWYEGD